MKRPDWMVDKGITWGDLLKITGSMGLLLFIIVVALIGAIGANI